MSSKHNYFDNRQAEMKSINSNIIVRPISNIQNIRIGKDHQTQNSLKIYNQSSKKLIQKTLTQNNSKTLVLETKKSLCNSKSNDHIKKTYEENIKNAYNEIRSSSKNKNLERENYISNNNENFNVSSFLKNSKEPLNFHDSCYQENEKDIYKIKNTLNSERELYEKSNFNYNHLQSNLNINNINSNSNIDENMLNKKFPVDANYCKPYSIENKNNSVNLNNNFNKSTNKPVINNKSLNLSNLNYINSINNKNSFNSNQFKNTIKKNNYVTNNNSMGNNNNFYFNNNSNNYPTILKSSFIMGGVEKRKSTESNNLNESEMQNILNNKNELITKIIDKAKDSKKDIIQKNKTSNQINKSLIKNFSNNNNLKQPNNYKNSLIKIENNNNKNKKDFSFNDINDSINDQIQNLHKLNKSRSISFNNIKLNNCPSQNNFKRPKSQTIYEVNNKIKIQNVESNLSSIEKKNYFENIKKKYLNILNDSKGFVLLDLKKKYNQVVKKKKIPTSLLMNSLKSSIDPNTDNNAISPIDKNLILKTNLFQTNTSKEIKKSTSKDNSNNLKGSINNNKYYKIDSSSPANLNFNNILKNNIQKLENKINSKLDKKNKDTNYRLQQLKDNIIVIQEEINNNKNKIAKNSNNSNNLNNPKNKENIISNDIDKNNNLISKKSIPTSNPKKDIDNYHLLNNRLYCEDKSNLDNNNNNYQKFYNNKNKNNEKLLKNIKLLKNNIIGFNTDNEIDSKLMNNFEKLQKEELIDKKIRPKNMSFNNSQHNWNNLILKNNINIYKSKMNKIDNLLKFNLQKIDNENPNKSIKQTIVSKKTNDYNHINELKEKMKKKKNVISIKSYQNKNNFVLNNNFSYGNLNKIIIKHESQKNSNLSKEDNKNLENDYKGDTIYSNIYKVDNVNDKCERKNSSIEKQYEVIKELMNSSGLTNLKISNNFNTIKEDINQFLSRNNEFNNEINMKLNDKHNTNPNETKNSNQISSMKNYVSLKNNNIKICDNDSDIRLYDISKCKLESIDKDLLFSNINTTESQLCQEIEFESRISSFKNLENNSHLINEDYKNNFSLYKNNDLNFDNKEIMNKSNEDKNLFNNLIIESTESLNNFSLNKSVSICSKWADDIENMNTIMKRFDFNDVNKYEESIFNLNNILYQNFNIQYKYEIETHLFPQKNQINSVRKRSDSNSKSVSTQDTSSKKNISPNNWKSSKLSGLALETGREKINLYHVHLSKI